MVLKSASSSKILTLCLILNNIPRIIENNTDSLELVRVKASKFPVAVSSQVGARSPFKYGTKILSVCGRLAAIASNSSKLLLKTLLVQDRTSAPFLLGKQSKYLFSLIL